MEFWKTVGIIAAALVASGAAAYGLARLFMWLRDERQGYPGEEEIEAVLLPFALQGVMAAFHFSEKAADIFKQRLDGADKAEIANKMFDLLPQEIVIGKFTLPIESIITRERFADLVQRTYDVGMEKFEELWSAYGNLIGEMVD